MCVFVCMNVCLYMRQNGNVLSLGNVNKYQWRRMSFIRSAMIWGDIKNNNMRRNAFALNRFPLNPLLYHRFLVCTQWLLYLED